MNLPPNHPANNPQIRPQKGKPPWAGGGKPPCVPPPCVPIDGGLWLLAMGAGALGVSAVKDRMKNKINQ